MYKYHGVWHIWCAQVGFTHKECTVSLAVAFAFFGANPDFMHDSSDENVLIIPSDQVTKCFFLTEGIFSHRMFQFAFRPGTPPEFLCFSILTCLVISLLEVLISQSWWSRHDHFLRFQTCKNLFFSESMSQRNPVFCIAIEQALRTVTLKASGAWSAQKGRFISHMKLWTWWCHNLALHVSFPLSIPRYLWIYIYI